LKISDTNQQINNKPELPKVDSTDSLTGGKKTEQKSKSSVTVTGSSAIKTDTVQLSRESQALANSDKAKSGDKDATVQKEESSASRSEAKIKVADKQSNAGEKAQTKGIQNVINKSSLVELLKKSDEQSGILGVGEGISRTNEQEDIDNKSGNKIDLLL
jgi:hypothetical protein